MARQSTTQVAVTNRLTGTILHEAIQYRCSNDVVAQLLQLLVDYQQHCVPTSNGNVMINAVDNACPVANKKICCNLLSVQDDIGRTALHCMVGRWQQFYLTATESSLTSSHPQAGAMTDTQLFKRLLETYPKAASTMDADGNTPLMMLLQTPRVFVAATTETTGSAANLLHDIQETELQNMVELILAVDLNIATMARKKLPQQSRWCQNGRNYYIGAHNNNYHNFPLIVEQHYRLAKTTPFVESLIAGMGNTPLYYALLNGRSTNTIQMLINANKVRFSLDATHHHAGLSHIITQYNKVCLHIAVTTKAPLSVIQLVLMEHPAAVIAPDTYGLTPLDWLWICHARDWHDNNNNSNTIRHHNRSRMSRLISRRRHLPNQFLEWYQVASAHVETAMAKASIDDDAINNNNIVGDTPSSNITTGRRHHDPIITGNNIHPETVIRHQHDLFGRIQMLLTTAAESYAAVQDQHESNNNPLCTHHQGQKQKITSWSLLHAACYVPCPLAMVRLVLAHTKHASDLEHYGQREDVLYDPLRCRDLRAGRYPLYYAAGRVGYTATYPVGFSCGIKVLREPSPVHDILPLFPAACRATDGAGQLPLHVTIDAFQQHRATTLTMTSLSSSSSGTFDEVNDEEDKVIQSLLSHNPSALDMRDGCTKLYPWQQAAVGTGARLTMIYQLLRFNPTLLTTK